MISHRILNVFFEMLSSTYILYYILCKNGKFLQVKLVYNDHDPKIVAVVERWSLLRGHICYKSSKSDLKVVVVTGGRYSQVVGSSGLTVSIAGKQDVCKRASYVS
jgi:hypothetical protein